jgi:hypothetical protein
MVAPFSNHADVDKTTMSLSCPQYILPTINFIFTQSPKPSAAVTQYTKIYTLIAVAIGSNFADCVYAYKELALKIGVTTQ